MNDEQLRTALDKALQDASYWRNMYDKLLTHIEHQSKYIRHLEEQTWRNIVRK